MEMRMILRTDRSTVNTLVNNIISFIIVMLLLLDGGSMYSCIADSPIKGSMIKAMLILICLFGVLFQNNLSKSTVVTCGILGLILFVYIIGTRLYNLIPFGLYSMVFICLMMYLNGTVKKNRLRNLLDSFSMVVTIIAAISVFFWLFGSVLHLIPKSPIYYYWGREYPYRGYSYFFLYFENPVQASGSIIRNTGIYTEAPGYVTRLMVALCIEMFYFSKRPHKIRMIILLIAMMSTLSSKGLIILIYFIGVRWFFYSELKFKMNKFVHLCIILVAIVIGSVAIKWILQAELSTSSSSMTRYDHMRSGIITWLQHPLFGAGYCNDKAISLNHLYSNTPEGASMGIPTFLAEGGLFLFLFYICSSFPAFRYAKRNKRKKDMLLFFIALLIEWFISNIANTTIMMAIICLGYCTIHNKKRGVAQIRDLLCISP